MVNKVTTVFENDTTAAVKSNEQLATSLEGTESKAKLVAQALHTQADQIDADFKASVAASDALAKALGPDMATKIGQNGIDKFVADLKASGLTAGEIEADVDSLAGALQHLDSVGKNLDGPKQGLRDVGDSATHAKTEIAGVAHEGDNSRSVLANMTGNATQDLGQLGGVAGTTGMALGQMAEYATEGNISMQGLAKVAGPMAAVTVATLALTQGTKQAAEANARLTKSYQDLSAATDQQALDSLGKILIDSVSAGKSLDTVFQNMADTNVEGARRLHDLMEAEGQHKEMTDLLGTAIAATDAKTAQAAITTQRYGDTTKAAADKAAAATQVYQDQVTTTSDEVQRKLDEITAKWDELNGRINAEKSMIQYKQQVDDVKAAIAAVGQAEIDHGVGSPEALAAKENARLKTLDLESTTASLGATILGLPAEQVTDLIARIDRGELDNMPGIIQSTLDTHTYRIKAHLDSIVIDGETHAAGSTSLTVNGRSNVIRAAAGGYFPPKPGGWDLNVAEAGKGEYVIPEDQMGVGGGITVIQHIYGSVQLQRDLVRAVADGIVDAQRRGEIPPGIN